MSPRRVAGIRRRASSSVSRAVVAALLDGREACDFCAELDLGAVSEADAEGRLAEAWEAIRDAALARWVALAPGTRPLAWWRFDAPEPRRVRSAVPARDVAPGTRAPDVATFTARPFPGPWWRYGIAACATWPLAISWETEAAYLKRLRLLLPGEAARAPRLSPVARRAVADRVVETLCREQAPVHPDLAPDSVASAARTASDQSGASADAARPASRSSATPPSSLPA